jgi:hypothetical protein
MAKVLLKNHRLSRRYGKPSMRILGKSFLTVATAWLILSLYAIFWPSTFATVTDKSNIGLIQNGYNGVSKPGISNFKGATSSFNLVSYRYAVNGSMYEGTGSINLGADNRIKIYYCPIYPAFSLTNNTIPLPWLLLLCIIGIGFLEINKWLNNLLKQKQP